jgi:hypothetical protein
MTMLAKILLLTGIVCVVLAGWSLIQGEVHSAILGFGLGVLLLLNWDSRSEQAVGPGRFHRD